MIQEFKDYLEKKKSEFTSPNTGSSHNTTNEEDGNFDLAFIPPKNTFDDEDESSHDSNPFTVESTANYMFHKILSATSYGIGKKTHDYLIKFEEKYSNIEEAIN